MTWKTLRTSSCFWSIHPRGESQGLEAWPNEKAFAQRSCESNLFHGMSYWDDPTQKTRTRHAWCVAERAFLFAQHDMSDMCMRVVVEPSTIHVLSLLIYCTKSSGAFYWNTGTSRRRKARRFGLFPSWSYPIPNIPHTIKQYQADSQRTNIL